MEKVMGSVWQRATGTASEKATAPAWDTDSEPGRRSGGMSPLEPGRSHSRPTSSPRRSHAEPAGEDALEARQQRGRRVDQLEVPDGGDCGAVRVEASGGPGNDRLVHPAEPPFEDLAVAVDQEVVGDVAPFEDLGVVPVDRSN